MKDYNIQIKVRNNFLLTAMREAGFKNAAQLARASGNSQMAVGGFLNLTKTPYNQDGRVCLPMDRICDTLGKEVTELFPSQHLTKPLPKNTGEALVGMDEISKLLPQSEMVASALLESPEDYADREVLGDSIYAVFLEALTPKEHKVIEMRFGLNGHEEHTLAEIGDCLDVTPERIRQFESKAMRKLRHPKQPKNLKQHNRLA